MQTKNTNQTIVWYIPAISIMHLMTLVEQMIYTNLYCDDGFFFFDRPRKLLPVLDFLLLLFDNVRHWWHWHERKPNDSSLLHFLLYRLINNNFVYFGRWKRINLIKLLLKPQRDLTMAICLVKTYSYDYILCTIRCLRGKKCDDHSLLWMGGPCSPAHFRDILPNGIIFGFSLSLHTTTGSIRFW